MRQRVTVKVPVTTANPHRTVAPNGHKRSVYGGYGSPIFDPPLIQIANRCARASRWYPKPKFYRVNADIQLVFNVDETGAVESLTVHQFGQQRRAPQATSIGCWKTAEEEIWPVRGGVGI